MLLAIAKIPEDHMKTLKNNYNAKAIDTTGRGFDIMPEKIYENFYHLIRNRIIFNYQLYKREQYTTVKDVTYDNKSDEKIIILILTDALRPDHMSINGYHRDTTPLMKKNGFISFNDMYACDTATTRSVQCLLSRMKRKSYMYSYLDEPSIFYMFNSANFYTVWFSESAKKDVDLSIIEKNKNKISTHDAVFHSIVGCSGIKSSMVNDEENICSEKFIEAPNEFENYISKPLE